MHDLDRTGGFAALFLAASYIFGFALFFGAMDGTGYSGPAGSLAFAADHQAVLTLAMTVLYIAAGCALVALSVAMQRRAATTVQGGMQIAAAFGLIWAGVVIASGMVSSIGMQAIVPLAQAHPETATSAWAAISVVQDALGGGIELLGGVWMALVSWLAMKSHQMPRALAWLGIGLGLIGIATIVPALTPLTDIFGLGQIIWFAWLGIILLRPPLEPILVDS